MELSSSAGLHAYFNCERHYTALPARPPALRPPPLQVPTVHAPMLPGPSPITMSHRSRTWSSGGRSRSAATL